VAFIARALATLTRRSPAEPNDVHTVPPRPCEKRQIVERTNDVMAYTEAKTDVIVRLLEDQGERGA
jgi:hypothetical protein